MKEIFKYFLLGFLLFILVFTGYFFIGSAPSAEKITWGVNFSQKYAESLGLNWRETLISLLGDLEVRNLKIATYWDLLEKEEGQYNFEDLDWQIDKSKDFGARIFLAIGLRTPRWPECHIPGWAKNLSEEEQQGKILKLLEKIVLRYRDESHIWAWQVENETFFPFGECPWSDKDFLKKEISLVKSLDAQNRPVIITESGEIPFWIQAAQYGDIVGVTMYKKVWFREIKMYLTYPLPPIFYYRKAEIIKRLFGKEVIGVELQAEPWTPGLIYNSSLEEQQKTMDLKQFGDNIEFAKKSGLNQHYLWGAEWWYWMKEKQGKPEIWLEARRLFRVNKNE